MNNVTPVTKPPGKLADNTGCKHRPWTCQECMEKKRPTVNPTAGNQGPPEVEQDELVEYERLGLFYDDWEGLL